MKIMVFLQGTVIMHKGALGKSRDERVRQVQQGEQSVRDFASYVPVGEAARKLRSWRQQGAELVYLSSHSRAEDVATDKAVLQRCGFPAAPVLWRHARQDYAGVAESALPDILIEDDCESIGGEGEMTYPHIRAEMKARIRSVVVQEFGGIDHLPDDLAALRGS